MKKANTTLRRKPLLTPVWLAALAALAALAVLLVVSFTIWLWGTSNSTIVVIIGPAEQQVGVGDNAPLSDAGIARSNLLARMLGDTTPVGRIDAIYASAARGDQMTAAPLAALLSIQITTEKTDDSKWLARQVLRKHAGGRILVVGHGDTVAPLVMALSGSSDIPMLRSDDKGAMYVVTVPRIGRASVLRLDY